MKKHKTTKSAALETLVSPKIRITSIFLVTVIVISSLAVIYPVAAMFLFKNRDAAKTSTPIIVQNIAMNFVVYEKDGSIFGTRILQDGTIKDQSGIKISGTIPQSNQPKVITNGDKFFAAWENEQDSIWANIIKTDGTVQASSSIFIDTFGTNLQLAYGTKKNMIVWEYNNRIHANIVNKDGMVENGSSIFISEGSDPRVIWNGEKFLIVWNSTEDGKKVKGLLFDENGIYGNPFVIAEDGEGVELAQGATKSFVIYRTGNFLSGKRVLQDGTIEDTNGVYLGHSNESPLLDVQITHSSANNFLISFREEESPITSVELFKDNDPSVSGPVVYGTKGELARGATRDVVVYEREGKIYGAILSKDGSLQRKDIMIGTGSNHRVITSGVAFFVTWQNEKSEIRGTAVHADGSVVNPEGLLINTGKDPEAAFIRVNNISK